MPTNLNDDPTDFPASISVPIGSDPRTDVSVQGPFQQLANRSANLKARIDAIAPVPRNGVSAFYRVANDAALLAIGATDHTDKVVCLVDGVGLYEFDASSALTSSAPFVRQPNDVPNGAPGRWVLVGAGAGVLGAPNGLPQCDAGGRIPAATVRGGILGTATWLGNNLSSGASGQWTDVTGSAQPLSGLLPGDLVVVMFAGGFSTAQNILTQLRAAMVQPDASTVGVGGCWGSTQTISTSDPVRFLSCVGTFPVSQAGSHTLKVQFNNNAGGSISIVNMTLLGIALRP
jgi:hypothetical protein